MISYLPQNEAQRLTLLQSREILDTGPEKEYDDLVALAAQICDAPSAVLSMIGGERQQFKARFGYDYPEIERRKASFGNHAIAQPDKVFVVEDTLLDERFVNHPLVVGEPQIRFYAAVAILIDVDHILSMIPGIDGFGASNEALTTEPHSSDRISFGTLTVLDYRPRTLTGAQIDALQKIAGQASHLIYLHTQREAMKRYAIAMKEASVRLHESERRLNNAQEIARLGSWSYDLRQSQVTWSKETFRLLGFDPADGEPTFAMLQERFPVRDWEINFEKVENTLKTGEPFEIDLCLPQPQGKRLWIHSRGEAIRNESGEITGVVGTMQDVTESREAQRLLSSITEGLHRSNAALNEFILVAAHDLREPLRKLRVYMSKLSQELGAGLTALPAPTVNTLERMQAATFRMQTLIEGLMTLAQVSKRFQTNRVKRIDLNQIADDVLAHINSAATVTVKIVIDPLGKVTADPQLMRQLMYHLMDNAIHFHKPGEAPEIRIIRHDTDGHTGFRVQDQGIGFDPDHLTNIFNVFERLSVDDDSRAGVGLAICKRIMEGYGGKIEAFSDGVSGATFTVLFPESS